MKTLSKDLMMKALKRLDKLLKKPAGLIVGGGGGMVLAHAFPLATTDIDAVPTKIGLEELDEVVKKVARELNIPPDWLNPYFSSFMHVLPADYGTRLIEVYNGRYLQVLALGQEDLMIMKCFAHRPKDVAHARALLKSGVNITFVENHIETLKAKKWQGCDQALEFLDRIMDE